MMGILFPDVQVSSTHFSSEQPLLFWGLHPNIGPTSSPALGELRGVRKTALRSPGGFVFTSRYGHCSSSQACWFTARCPSTLGRIWPRNQAHPGMHLSMSHGVSPPSSKVLANLQVSHEGVLLQDFFFREMPNIFTFPFLSIHRTP